MSLYNTTMVYALHMHTDIRVSGFPKSPSLTLDKPKDGIVLINSPDFRCLKHGLSAGTGPRTIAP
jgi:hypothetical protein